MNVVHWQHCCSSEDQLRMSKEDLLMKDAHSWIYEAYQMSVLGPTCWVDKWTEHFHLIKHHMSGSMIKKTKWTVKDDIVSGGAPWKEIFSTSMVLVGSEPTDLLPRFFNGRVIDFGFFLRQSLLVFLDMWTPASESTRLGSVFAAAWSAFRLVPISAFEPLIMSLLQGCFPFSSCNRSKRIIASFIQKLND